MTWAKQRPLLKIIIVRIVALEVFELLFGNMETVCGVLTPLLPIRDLLSFFYKRFNADKCMALLFFWYDTLQISGYQRGAWPLNEAPGHFTMSVVAKCPPNQKCGHPLL